MGDEEEMSYVQDEPNPATLYSSRKYCRAASTVSSGTDPVDPAILRI